MARTTIAAVQKIISYDAVLIPDIQPFIDDASTMVTAIIAIDNTPLAASLEMTERYLAAHLIAVTDPRLQSEQVKTLQQSFQVRLMDGLGITHFGQTAMQLDTTGRLARWNKQVVEGGGSKQFFWSGESV